MAKKYSSQDEVIKDLFLGRPTSDFELGTNSRRRRRISPPSVIFNPELGTEYARIYQNEEYTTCLKVSVFTCG